MRDQAPPDPYPAAPLQNQAAPFHAVQPPALHDIAEQVPKEHQPLIYVALALCCALLAGVALTASGTYHLGPRLVLAALALAAMSLALVEHMRAVHRAEAHRLELFGTKLHESEDRFRQAQKMEAVGQLTGGIAHDFNNLVTVIGCSVGLLSEAISPDDPHQDDLNQIKEATDRAATLTRQLLAFSRRQILQPRSLNLNVVVQDIEKMLQRVIGSHITVHANLDPKLGQVLTDLGQMEQVIMNLAVNARDAMSDGGELDFTTGNSSIIETEYHMYGDIPPGEYVTLKVRDSGEGIPKPVLDHMFEPFFTTKERGKGTGLGLATVHGIVYQSGGHIAIDSTPGKGSTFTLYFPRIRNEDEPRRSVAISPNISRCCYNRV